MCHIGATSWALRAYAELGTTAPDSAWDFMLSEQVLPKGYWTLYSSAVPSEDNASVYATAIAVLAFFENLDKGLVSGQNQDKVRRRIERASSWLLSTANQGGCAWVDYPGRPQTAKCIPALVGIVIYTLEKTGHSVSQDFNVFQLADVPLLVQEADVSRVDIELKDGATAIDHVGHISLPWVGLALLENFSDAGWLDRARVRRFFHESFFGETKTPEVLLDETWKRAEVAILVRELLKDYEM